MLREVREKAYETLHGPAHRWERPPDSVASSSHPSVAGPEDTDGAGSSKCPTRLSSTARSNSSTGTRERGGSIGLCGDLQIQGGGSHRNGHGGNTYRYRLSEASSSAAGEKTLVSIARVTLEVSAREPTSESIAKV